MAEQIFTVGHSNKPIEEFVALLQAAEIQTLIDVRTSPWSRWNPQFNEKPMRSALLKAGLQYEGRGKNLGGLGENVMFDATLDELAGRARSGERMALCCSEGDYHKCHRFSMLTPPLETRGLDVVHLMWDGKQVTNGGATPAQPKPVKPDTQLLFEFDLPAAPEKLRRGGFIAP